MRSQYAARIEGGKKSGKFVVVSAALAAKILAAPAGRPVTIDGVTYGVLAHVPPAHAAAGETAWRAQHGHADRLWTWDFGAQFHHGGLPRNNPKGNPMRKNPPMLTVAMFDPRTMAGVQRTVPALTADEAVHKLFDKFPPRPGHHIEVRRDGRLIGQWFVAKGAHQNPEILHGVTGDHSGRVAYSQREDGQWFARYLEKSQWGYRWGAWRKSGPPAGRTEPDAVGRKSRLPKHNPEMIKPAVSATALANMAMYYVVISGKVPPAVSTVVRAPNAALAALEVSKYDDVHPGDIAAVYSMGYGPGGKGGQLIEKFRVRAIHANPTAQQLMESLVRHERRGWKHRATPAQQKRIKAMQKAIERRYRTRGF